MRKSLSQAVHLSSFARICCRRAPHACSLLHESPPGDVAVLWGWVLHKKFRAALTHFVASLSFVMPFHSGIVGRPKRRSECFIGEETQTKPTTNIKNGATHQPSHAKGAEGTRFGECRPPRNNHHHIIITCHEIVAPTFASRRGLQDNPCTIPRRCMRRGFGSRCHR